MYMSAWITFLRGYYNDRKKIQANYTYKNAMKDAAKEYKKGHKTTSSHKHKHKKMRRTRRRR